MKLFSIISLLIILFVSCETTTKNIFIVQRDVPENPSITVVSYGGEVQADFMEETLIQLGIKIMRLGASKVITEKTDTQGTASGVAPEKLLFMRGGQTIEERYVVREVKSDYLFVIDGNTNRLKIIKVSNEEIISSSVLPFNSFSLKLMDKIKEWEYKNYIHDLLISLGMKPKNLPPKPIEEGSKTTKDTINVSK